MQLWDASTGEKLQTLNRRKNRAHAALFPFNALSILPDSKQLASASEREGTIEIWDVATGVRLLTLENAGRTTSLAFSPDGRQLASSSPDGTARLWDAVTRGALQIEERHEASITMVVFSPDGKQLAMISDDQTVRLWEAATGTMQRTLDNVEEMIDEAREVMPCLYRPRRISNMADEA